ncbi:MAG: hypothetical protein ACREYC_28145 [Gammaproteobacteria bacterium]
MAHNIKACQRDGYRYAQPILNWLVGEHLNSREEIADIQEETPSLTEAVIRQMGDKCFTRRKTRGRRRDESENADRRIIME